MDNVNPENKLAEEPESQATPDAPSPSPAESGAQEAAEDIYAACRREITVEIPAEEVEEQRDSLVKNYTKQARVPGFRQGKVPGSVVKNRFADKIQEDLLERLVPQYFRVAVMSNGLQPISAPAITKLEAKPGEPVRFTARFDVMPEFELGDYKSIPVEKPEVKVTDEDVEAELQKLRENQASYDAISEERAAADGDFAQVSFQATPKDESTAAPEAEAAKPVKMDEVLVEIGGANTIPEFSENIRGMKAGEERSFDVVYPAEFHDPRLAGKTFSYHVKLNVIKKKTTPELNDDFAKQLSQEIQGLDELKQRMRENMEHQLFHEAEHAAKEKLIEALIEKHAFPVPQSMVEHHIDLRLERGLRALAAQGMRTEDMKRLDFPRLRAAQRDAATKEVKSGILLHRIADAEDIQVSDQELDQEIVTLAQQTNQTPEEVRKQLSQDNGLDRIRARMRGEKALNFLYYRPEE
ncbi:MAG: trigger factor [Acidobacteriia bacterium]|nr:trigger factor [Terriglobia bacterium]